MSAGLNIVVADESASAREAAVLIARWGHRVEQAHDGFAAIDEARRLKPELMLLGLSLPGLNGFGVVHQLRQTPELNAMRFIALLDLPGDATLRDLKRAGFSHNLIKPIAPLELLTSIVKTRDAIQRSRRLALSAKQVVARGRDRTALSRQGLDEYRTAIETSRQSLDRALPAMGDEPLSALALIEALLTGGYLDSDQKSIASKVISSGEQSLSPWESKIYERLTHRYLTPACKLCRYRIPRGEVMKSWENGGYCTLCAQAMN